MIRLRFLLMMAVAVVALTATPASVLAQERFLTDEAAVSRILDIADQRLSVMPAVAATKWQTHSPIADPERERVVIKHSGELASPSGLSAESVERVFEIQVRLGREWEERLTEDWQAHGFSYTGPIPDLAKEIRPQLDKVTTGMLAALYLAAPVLRRPQFIERYGALAEQHLRSAGWDVASRKEFLTVLAGVRQSPTPTLQRVSATGILRVGVTGDYAPFSVESGDRLSGADVELAKRLAEHLRAQPVFIRTSWHSVLGDLREGDFDAAMGGISVTPERQAEAAFSMPYSTGGKTILARCADAARFHDLAGVDHSRVRVIVNPGGTNEQYVRANLHKAQIRVYPDNRTIFEEIRAKRADVMITDDTEVELQVHQHPDLCRVFSGTLTHADKAILLPKEPPFVDAVDTWLKDEIAAGEPERLLRLR